jgi:hypothetical protein
MAELLFTQEELNNYIQSLDSNNENNFKVLSSLQLLKPSLFTDIIYLLINGSISITSLYNININNYTISQLVNNAYSNPNTITERSVFYKNFIKALPGFNIFMSSINLNYPNYLASKNISSTSLSKEIIIDNLKLISGSYGNLREPQIIYNNYKSAYITDISNIIVGIGITTFNYSETLISNNNINYTLSFLPNTGSLSLYKNGIMQNININYKEYKKDDYFKFLRAEDQVVLEGDIYYYKWYKEYFSDK